MEKKLIKMTTTKNRNLNCDDKLCKLTQNT